MSQKIKKRVFRTLKKDFFYSSTKRSIEEIIKNLEKKGIWK
jgi:hypothetical protein